MRDSLWSSVIMNIEQFVGTCKFVCICTRLMIVQSHYNYDMGSSMNKLRVCVSFVTPNVEMLIGVLLMNPDFAS